MDFEWFYYTECLGAFLKIRCSIKESDKVGVSISIAQSLDFFSIVLQ